MTPTSSIAIISMLALSTGACATAPSSVVTSAPAPASAIPKIDAQLSARDELDDSEITVAVEHMLANELGTSARDIRVVTTAGVVQLTGTAPHLLASDRAMLLAELIRGVRSVSNQIQVTRSARSDSEIADEVDRAFVLDPATESFEIDVSVSDRVVALQGTVSSWTEKQLATRVARGIRGVRAVEDEIDVRYELTRADQEILADIESRLEWDAIVDEGLIDVGVTEGVVVLTGAVGSAAERRRARGLAWVAGVQDVYDAELRVSWWLDEPRARDEEYVPKSAKEVRAALETAMLLDPRVASFSVTPEVDGSHVVLRGTVDNLRAKLSAGQIARHTVGVAAVDNRLEVEPRRVLTDLEIEDGLRWSLVANPITEAHEIGVDVDDGSATLTGMVGSLAERAEAEDIALGTTGVRAVVNAIQVDDPARSFIGRPLLYPYYPLVQSWASYVLPTPTSGDGEVAREIEQQMRWSPYVDARSIDVSVVNGVATLDGTVRDRTEHGAAMSSAYAGGAIKVVDQLSIEVEQ